VRGDLFHRLRQPPCTTFGVLLWCLDAGNAWLLQWLTFLLPGHIAKCWPTLFPYSLVLSAFAFYGYAKGGRYPAIDTWDVGIHGFSMGPGFC